MAVADYLGKHCLFYFEGDVIICFCSWHRCGDVYGHLLPNPQKKLGNEIIAPQGLGMTSKDRLKSKSKSSP